MAADARLSIWAQVQAERTRGTGDRRRNEYRSLPIVPSKQVRRALSTARHLMQTIFDDRILELWTPGPWSRGTGNLARVQRSQLLQQFRLLTLAENAREETLKESLGGFRFAAFVQHDKSRHGA